MTQLDDKPNPPFFEAVKTASHMLATNGKRIDPQNPNQQHLGTLLTDAGIHEPVYISNHYPSATRDEAKEYVSLLASTLNTALKSAGYSPSANVISMAWSDQDRGGANVILAFGSTDGSTPPYFSKLSS